MNPMKAVKFLSLGRVLPALHLFLSYSNITVFARAQGQCRELGDSANTLGGL